MDHLAKKLFHLIMISILAVTINACSPQEKDGDSSGSTGGTSPVDDVPVGNVEETGFWVNVITDQFKVYMKKRDNWDEDCFISKDTTDNQAIECVLDVMEGDLYSYDMELQYNAPPGMCDHVGTYPAWFWNQSFGTGPSTVTVNVDSSGDPSVVSSCVAYAETALEMQVEGGMYDGNNLINCSLHPELTDVANTSGPSCTYDASDTEGLSNCCFGDYTLTIVDNDGATTTTTTSDLKWGGDVATCIAPHISNGWDDFTSQGYPSWRLEVVPKDPTSQNPIGLNISRSLKANGSTTHVNWSTWANWFEQPGVANVHTHTGFYSTDTSNVPYAYDPIDDLSGTDLTGAKGSTKWTFLCLDAAFEVRQRVDLYIREWNTLTDFLTYGTSDGVTYNPDLEGKEGVACDYGPVFGGNPDFHNNECNDKGDFDDLVNSTSGPWNTTPGVDEGRRANYFPNLITD